LSRYDVQFEPAIDPDTSKKATVDGYAQYMKQSPAQSCKMIFSER